MMMLMLILMKKSGTLSAIQFSAPSEKAKLMPLTNHIIRFHMAYVIGWQSQLSLKRDIFTWDTLPICMAFVHT